jgi:hypothetical protein
MVRVVIYVEGANVGASSSAIDSSTLFRENFHRLLAQVMPTDGDLSIQVIGSIHNAPKYLERINAKKDNAALLVDLDGPPSERETRVTEFYGEQDVRCLFFMVQEMESWIISQPKVLDGYAINENLVRGKKNEDIGNNKLLKDKHPQDISDPAAKLNTLFRQYFKAQKIKDGKTKLKPRSYIKSKDGPQLIGLLNYDRLKADFEDAERLGFYLSCLVDGNQS